VLRGHTAPVTVLAFARDGKHLASGSGDGTVRIWRAPTLEEIAAAEKPRRHENENATR
jgi:WD40 repeat protein